MMSGALPEDKTVVIVQSSYIPWKGFFDMVNRADELVLYDDMQYTVRDWRNRNKIKTANGLHWLSIPIDVKGKRFQKIKDAQIADSSWADKHWKTISFNYSKAAAFDKYSEWLASLYQEVQGEMSLSRVNHHFISAICKELGISTRITFSMDYELVEGRTEKLLNICLQAGATHYLSGPSAQDYMDESLFEENDVTVEYMDYSGYSEYEQLFPPYEHGVSILDLLLNKGSEATSYLKTFPQ